MKFSLITATYNRKDMLIEAIESAIAQGFDDYEHIIVDGGSNDGTLEALKAYPHLQIISEPDDGVYDAMNKGIRAAQGEVIVLLNSDDLLPAGTLEYAAKYFNADAALDALYGAVCVQDMDGNEVHRIDDPKILNLSRCPDTSYPIVTNGRFLKKGLFERLGLFDIDFPRLSDNDLFLKLKHLPHKFEITQRVLYAYRTHDDSLTIRGNFADASVWQEYLDVALKGAQAGEKGGALYKDYRDLLAWSLFRCWCFGVFSFWEMSKKLRLVPNAPIILASILVQKISRKLAR